MPYERLKSKKLEEDAISLIKTKNLFFHEDVIAYLGIAKGTYYNHKLNEMDSIKEALELNRVITKNSMRKKWAISDSSALQIGLYKLIATKEEQRALSMQTIDLDIPEDLEITINIKK